MIFMYIKQLEMFTGDQIVLIQCSSYACIVLFSSSHIRGLIQIWLCLSLSIRCQIFFYIHLPTTHSHTVYPTKSNEVLYTLSNTDDQYCVSLIDWVQTVAST